MTSTASREVQGRSARDTRERVAGHPVVGASARLGLVARGALYVLVGLLTIRLATGDHDERADKSGALAAVARQPFGKALLVALAIGFAAYGVWMLVRIVALGDERPTGWAKRAIYGGRAVVYGALCFSAIDALRRSSSATQQQGTSQEHEWTARVLGWPFGQWLVAAVGIAIAIGGVVFVVRGVSQQWRTTLELPASRRARSAVVALGCAAWTGRGIVFGLVGAFLVRAAWRFDPNDAVGLDNSLRELAHGGPGRALMYVAAAGLFAFGVYSFVEARLRRVDDAGGPD